MGELVPAQAGRAAGPRRQAMTATAMRGLSRFAEAGGVPPSREFLLDYDVIEAFCVTGLRGRKCSTRGTYRSALYRLAEAAHGPPGLGADSKEDDWRRRMHGHICSERQGAKAEFHCGC